LEDEVAVYNHINLDLLDLLQEDNLFSFCTGLKAKIVSFMDKHEETLLLNHYKQISLSDY